MDDRLKGFIEYTRDKIGLVNHHLHRYMILREKNVLNGTDYILAMEWFPKDDNQSKIDEDYNPPGTVVVDLDIHSHKFRRVIFVGGKSDSNQYVKEQLTLFEVPSRKQEKWLSIYVMEEVFVTNEGKQKIPYELGFMARGSNYRASLISRAPSRFQTYFRGGTRENNFCCFRFFAKGVPQ